MLISCVFVVWFGDVKKKKLVNMYMLVVVLHEIFHVCMLVLCMHMNHECTYMYDIKKWQNTLLSPQRL